MIAIVPTPSAVEMEQWLPLVRRLAATIARKLPVHIRRNEYADLVQDGVFGLAAAIRNFDPARGVKFSTYARTRICGSMLDAIRNRDWMSRNARQHGDGRQMISMGRPVHEGDGLSHAVVNWEDQLQDCRRAAPADWVSDGGYSEGMTRKESLIFRLYWEAQLTMREVGGAVGLSESRVSQILKALLGRLRDRLGRAA